LKCGTCGRDAFYRRPYSGEVFCRSCYPEAFEKRVREAITSKRMLRPTERLAVGVSGGKDSLSLLHVLAKIEKGFPSAKLVAVTVDEGIDGYRGEAVNLAARSAEELGIEHHVVSFKALYGYTLDELAQRGRGLGQHAVCALCGVLRRKALNVAAREVGATKLATAHNLDDEAQSALMGLLRGTINELQREAGEAPGMVPRVKPFASTPERETALYAYLRRLRFQSNPCPYAGTSIRNEVRRFLDAMDEAHPGMKFTLLSTLEKLTYTKKQGKVAIGRCRLCGEPTSRDLCRPCELLQGLGLL